MDTRFKITVNGADITPLIVKRLVNLTITDERNGSVDQLDLEIANPDGDIVLPPPDGTLTAWLPDTNGYLVEMGTYTVDTREYDFDAAIISITARSADISDSLKVRREISYDATTIGGIINQIASRNSLIAVVDPEFSLTTVEHFDQTSESDLSVLERLGDIYGAVAKVKDGRIIFMPAGQGKTVTGLPLPAVDLVFGNVAGVRLREEKNQYTGVIAYWNETRGATREAVTAGNDVNPHKIRGTYRSAEQAQAAVNAKWQALQRATVQGTATLTNGNPHAQPESPVNWVGEWPDDAVKDGLIVARAVHSLNDDGYQTAVEMEQQV